MLLLKYLLTNFKLFSQFHICERSKILTGLVPKNLQYILSEFSVPKSASHGVKCLIRKLILKILKNVQLPFCQCLVQLLM